MIWLLILIIIIIFLNWDTVEHYRSAVLGAQDQLNSSRASGNTMSGLNAYLSGNREITRKTDPGFLSPIQPFPTYVSNYQSEGAITKFVKNRQKNLDDHARALVDNNVQTEVSE